LADFKGLPHRIVKVLSYGGVNFYDDSKGTNVGATVAAIRGLPETKVVLIAGGRDKLGSYEPLAKAMLERGRAAILIGEAAEKIGDALSGSVAVTRAATMTEAVERAAQAALPGDAVLLSPACSSFDMFRDYKHRGDTFVEAAQRLVTLGLI
jgi:UDP-N-acetylmuramoylalanine--D-glutamate ligase